MPEYEEYNFGEDPNALVSPPPQQAASGPPWTAANPPPPGSAPPGTSWMLNPQTGQFEPIQNGTMPPWGPIANPPQDPNRPAGPIPPQTQPPQQPTYDPIQTTYPQGGYSPMGGSYDPSGFSWPQFSGPTFTAPKAFDYEKFAAPDPQSIFSDPSYKMRRGEGLQAIEHGAAAKGLTRLPQTLKALGAWNQDFASREYSNIFDRDAQTYDRNRNNAADTYSLNYGIGRDVFDRNYTSARDQFQFNQFEPAKMTFDDLYRRYKAELDSTTSIATAGAGY